MAKVRLNSAEKVALTITPLPKTKKIGGRDIVTYDNYIRLAPNTTYESDDKAFLDYMREYKVKVRYNAEIERALKEHNVPYEVEYCKSCGGKIKKISYHPVEVEE